MDAKQIEEMIAAGLQCEHLEVRGDGHHWFATIVSPAFDGKRLIERHQLVYGALGSAMDSGALHALSMTTLTPQEWEQREG